MKKMILAAIAALAITAAPAKAQDNYGYDAAKREVARDVAVGSAIGAGIGWAMPGGPATAWAGAAIGAGTGFVYSTIIKPVVRK